MYLNTSIREPPTFPLVVHRHVGGWLKKSGPAVNHVDPALVLQLLSSFLQRLNEVLVRIGPDHPSLKETTPGQNHNLLQS